MPVKVQSTPPLPGLSPVGGKSIVARFDGGQLSSDAGVLALREIERRLGLAERLAACIEDPRLTGRVRHRMVDILRFRLLEVTPVSWTGTGLGWLRLRQHLLFVADG